MPQTISSTSREWVRVPVSAFESGQVVDPSASVVQFAFMPAAVAPDGTHTSPDPGSGDFVSGAWELANHQWIARCLVGPGATALVKGTYAVFCRITQAPEQPTRDTGLLVVK